MTRIDFTPSKRKKYIYWLTPSEAATYQEATAEQKNYGSYARCNTDGDAVWLAQQVFSPVGFYIEEAIFYYYINSTVDDLQFMIKMMTDVTTHPPTTSTLDDSGMFSGPGVGGTNSTYTASFSPPAKISDGQAIFFRIFMRCQSGNVDDSVTYKGCRLMISF